MLDVIVLRSVKFKQHESKILELFLLEKGQDLNRRAVSKESAKKRMLLHLARFEKNAQYRLQERLCKQNCVKLEPKRSMLKFTVIIIRGK